MATSTKVRFNLAELTTKALAKVQQQIADQELVVASFDDDQALQERIHEWRASQHVKLRELVEQLDNDSISDHDLGLALFNRFDQRPKSDRWEKHRAERDLRSLLNKRAEIEAKSSTLIADDDGGIGLTTTQLSQFFGL